LVVDLENVWREPFADKESNCHACSLAYSVSFRHKVLTEHADRYVDVSQNLFFQVVIWVVG